MTRKTILPLLAGAAFLVAPGVVMAQVVVQPGPTPSVHFGRTHFGNPPKGGVNVRGVNIGGISGSGINAGGINVGGVHLRGINPGGINPGGFNPGGINAGIAQIGGRNRYAFSGYRFYPPPYGIYELYPSVYGNPYTATPYDAYTNVPANLYPYVEGGYPTVGSAPYGLSRDELDILTSPVAEGTAPTAPPE